MMKPRARLGELLVDYASPLIHQNMLMRLQTANRRPCYRLSGIEQENVRD